MYSLPCHDGNGEAEIGEVNANGSAIEKEKKVYFVKSPFPMYLVLDQEWNA